MKPRARSCHCKCEAFHAMAMSTPHCDEASPLAHRRSRRCATSILKSLRYNGSVSCCKTSSGRNDAIKIFQFVSDWNSRVTEDPPVCIKSSCRGMRSTLNITYLLQRCCGMPRSTCIHLWFDSRSKTDMILIYDQSIRRPQLRRRLGLRYEDFFFCGTFNCNPTAARVSTSVSRTMPTKSNKIVIGAKQENVICKLQVQHSPAMIATITQIQTQMLHFITPIRHRHFRHGCSVITRLTPSGHKSDIRTSVQKLSTTPPPPQACELVSVATSTPPRS